MVFAELPTWQLICNSLGSSRGQLKTLADYVPMGRMSFLVDKIQYLELQVAEIGRAISDMSNAIRYYPSLSRSKGFGYHLSSPLMGRSRSAEYADHHKGSSVIGFKELKCRGRKQCERGLLQSAQRNFRFCATFRPIASGWLPLGALCT